MGYLAQADKIDDATLRRAVIYGSVMASFNVEEFSCDRLRRLTTDEIRTRYREFKEFTTFELWQAALRNDDVGAGLVPAHRRRLAPVTIIGCLVEVARTSFGNNFKGARAT